MTGKVIPFPRRPGIFAVEWVAGEGVTLTMICAPPVHYFTDRAKPCECGKERWPEERHA